MEINGTKRDLENWMPGRYELVDKTGKVRGTFVFAEYAARYAKHLWPDQEQDEERSGKGWDMQVVGADR